jgi:hypothetical protein
MGSWRYNGAPFRMPISRREFVLLAGAASRLPAAGGGFWNNKPPAQWSTGEIYQLVNQSPWARPVTAWRQLQLLPRWAPIPHSPKGVVTWESAQPVREAFKVPLPPEFEDQYVIGVDGIPLGETPYFDYLSGSTRLRCGGGKQWTAAVSEMRELVRNSVVYAFGFPRSSAPVARDSGDIFFETQFGPWLVQARFRPKEMVYRGRLAL